MATERVVEREVPVERVVERDAPVVVQDSGGMGVGGILAALLILAAIVIGGFFLLNMSRSEAVKDNAVAEAAGSVAESASSAAGAVTEAVAPR